MNLRQLEMKRQSMRRRPTIFLADDHSLFCELIAESIAGRFEIAGFAHDANAAARDVARLKPDVVLFDIAMPLLEGLETAMQIRESVPSARIVFLAVGHAASSSNALKVGTLGTLVKAPNASEVPTALWNLLRAEGQVTPAMFDEEEGERQAAYLTSREREVVQLLAEGKPMKQVADLLNVSTRTIAFHKYGVMRKLGLNSSAELIRMAVSQGLVA